MARENVKLNNLLNAKTGKKKEGVAHISRGQHDVSQRVKGWNRSGRRQKRSSNRKRSRKRNGQRGKPIRKGGGKKKRNTPNRSKNDVYSAN
jgi:hypothetical protein